MSKAKRWLLHAYLVNKCDSGLLSLSVILAFVSSYPQISHLETCASVYYRYKKDKPSDTQECSLKVEVLRLAARTLLMRCLFSLLSQLNVYEVGVSGD